MVKLINRLYFDYNATAPLSESVVNYLRNGAFVFGNPSSVYSEGREARKLISETFDFLKQLFHIPSEGHEIFFHSGATEAINSLVKGMAMYASSQGQKFHFFYSAVDHSSVVKQALHLPLLGHEAHAISVDSNGEIDVEVVIQKIKIQKGLKLFNFTQVNNETGVVWPLELAIKIKQATDCFVHVDSVQAPGKIINWAAPRYELDSYTFSAHKFGAMKGVGFTILNQNMPWIPMHMGGGQQKGLRAGTENTQGIYSIKLALEELVRDFAPQTLQSHKDTLELALEKMMGSAGQITGKKASHRNLNTINITFNREIKTELLLAALDLAGLAVSSGPACSMGVSVASRVLLEMGLPERMAKNSLRISLGPKTTAEDMSRAWEILSSVLPKYLDYP
ncbi:MAG: hypothetical protein A2X86_11545 [Bdellovibrionales bacterium GWA2_49_15]|nr:MAG: hypothetical protein A2X86_11545 [Bdellovibrionales bacterium GWA2_49_15]